MDKNMILEGLKEIVGKIMPKIDLANINNETKLAAELGLDSLAMLMLAFEIEDKFSVELRTGVKFTTVGDVVEYIEKAKK